MLQVSIILELLRAQPRLMVWMTALTQAALWWIVPSLFYAAPPGDLPILLAVGHEFQIGSFLGPPLPAWLAEAAFDLAGMPGVYLLSQACIVVAYWAVFTLGRAIVGEIHAAIAVMLMVGVAVFTVPTPEFGPAVLATPIAALMLLHFWRALGQGRRGYWALVAVDTGLLLMTSYAGLIFCLVSVAFTLGTARGRAALRTIDPWIAAVIVLVLMVPDLLWLDAAGDLWLSTLSRVLGTMISDADPFDWLRLILNTALLHGGLVILVALAAGWKLTRFRRVPVFLRPAVDPFARLFVYYHAVAPFLVASVVSVVFGERGLFGGAAPLVLLSALAVVVAGGDIITVHRQRLVGAVWAGWLIAPPLLSGLLTVTLPWIGADLQVTQPARAIGRYFSETFARRTGRPLEIVAGDPRLASLAALYARPRAHLYFDATPVRSPWITPADVAGKGAVVLWPATDAAGAVPTEIAARFPGLVPDVRQTFERSVQGRAPLLRIGWGLVWPQTARWPPP